MLSKIQLEEYNSKSCLFIPGVLNEVEVKNIQEWSLALPLMEKVEVVFEKGAITRCENFVHLHEGFRSLVDENGIITRICNEIFGEKSVLYKEKLNYKPAGGAGFMPHLDHPSLAFYSPKNMNSFMTVMVAIDDMTEQNGCLRVCKGEWNEKNAVKCIEPEGDPEVGGRAGAIENPEVERERDR